MKDSDIIHETVRRTVWLEAVKVSLAKANNSSRDALNDAARILETFDDKFVKFTTEDDE